MSESNKSDKTQELDNYGVWVKKPPRTVSSEADSEFNVVDNTPFDSGDKALTADELSALTAPSDFSTENTSADTLHSEPGENAMNTMNEMEDIDIDSFMDGADFSGGEAGDTKEQKTEANPAANETEDVSLDEFLDGGVFESDDGGSAASEKSEMEAKEKAANSAANSSIPEFSVSDDFSPADGITVSDAEPVSSQNSFADDAPLDIDLSFDDAPAADSSTETAAESSASSEPEFETIALDSFDAPASENSGVAQNSSSPTTFSDGSESVDLSEFGFDINAPESSSENESSETEEKKEESSSPASGETEEVDLSEFGFDINAPESTDDETETKEDSTTAEEEKTLAEKSEPAKTELPEQAQAEDISFEEIPSLDENGKQNEAETDLGSISFDEPAVSEETSLESNEPENKEPEVTEFSEPVIAETSVQEDEIPPLSNEEKIPEEDIKQESIDVLDIAAPSSEIPDSFDEETASLFADEPEATIVEQGEPVFEETSVDISEIPEPVSDSVSVTAAEEKTDDLNPFTLPPDDAFANQKIESEIPATQENNFVSAEPVFEEPEDKETNVSETESVMPEEPAPAAPAETKDALATPTSSEEKIADATAGKDAEIAASTNSILSQIVSELASLKSEISGLRNEFEEIKSKEAAAPAESPDEKEESTGFFSENGEDDTIALSVDELDNILNNAEMVNEEPDDSKKDEISEPAAKGTAETENPAEEKFEEPEISELEETISDDGQNELPDYISDDESSDAQDDIFVPKPNEQPETSEPKLESDEPAEETLPEENQNEYIPSEDISSNELANEEPVSENAEPELSSDDLSIGDFSFDDGAQDETSSDSVLPKEAEPVAAEPSESETRTTAENEAADSEPDSQKENPAEPEIETNSQESVLESAEQEEQNAETLEESAMPTENAEISEEPAISEISTEKADESTIDEPFDFGNENTADDEAKSIAISNDELENLLAPEPSISESLTDANLDYLASDAEIGKAENAEENPASSIPGNLQKEIKSVLSYMDQLLENLPEDKIAEFAQSEQFETYKKLFKELGLDK